MFMDQCELYGPFFDHVAAAWHAYNTCDNVFFTTYEKMVKNLREVVTELATFLGVALTEDQIATIASQCSFDQMKNNDQLNKKQTWGKTWVDFTVSPFMRSGKIGDWKNHFSSDLDEVVNTWIAREEARLEDKLDGFSFEYF